MVLPPQGVVVEYENLTKRAIEKLVLELLGFGNKYKIVFTTFESLDGWLVEVAGSGTAYADSSGTCLDTGATLGSKANIARERYSGAQFPPFASSWDKNPRVLFWFYCEHNINQEAFVGIGAIPYEIPNAPCMGFRIVDNKLYGIVADGVATSSVELWTIVTMESHKWEARLTSGVKCEFWMDGEKKAEIRTNLPSGVNDRGFWIGIRNTAAETKKLRLWLAVKIEDM